MHSEEKRWTTGPTGKTAGFSGSWPVPPVWCYGRFARFPGRTNNWFLQTIGQSDLKKLVGEEYRSAKIYYLSHFFKYIFHHFSCRIHFWCKINFELYQLWIVFMMNKKNYSSYKHWNFIIKNFVLNLILLFFYNKNIQT